MKVSKRQSALLRRIAKRIPQPRVLAPGEFKKLTLKPSFHGSSGEHGFVLKTRLADLTYASTGGSTEKIIIVKFKKRGKRPLVIKRFRGFADDPEGTRGLKHHGGWFKHQEALRKQGAPVPRPMRIFLHHRRPFSFGSYWPTIFSEAQVGWMESYEGVNLDALYDYAKKNERAVIDKVTNKFLEKHP